MNSKVCTYPHCTEAVTQSRRNRCDSHIGRCGVYLCPNRCGQPRPTGYNRYCGKHAARAKRGGAMDLSERKYKREWKVDAKGYMSRAKPGTHGVYKELQHRYVMELHLGRGLLPGENVHHINGYRTDNRLENLELWNTHQPKGQRVEDKVKWAKEILALYDPDSLA